MSDVRILDGNPHDTSDQSNVPGAPNGYGRGHKTGAAKVALTTDELQTRAELGDEDALRRLRAIWDALEASVDGVIPG